jgi:hypothetical protein
MARDMNTDQIELTLDVQEQLTLTYISSLHFFIVDFNI